MQFLLRFATLIVCLYYKAVDMHLFQWVALVFFSRITSLLLGIHFHITVSYESGRRDLS